MFESLLRPCFLPALQILPHLDPVFVTQHINFVLPKPGLKCWWNLCTNSLQKMVLDPDVLGATPLFLNLKFRILFLISIFLCFTSKLADSLVLSPWSGDLHKSSTLRHLTRHARGCLFVFVIPFRNIFEKVSSLKIYESADKNVYSCIENPVCNCN